MQIRFHSFYRIQRFMNVSHDYWAQIFVFEQTFRYIFSPLFDPNVCSVSTKGEQTFRETTIVTPRGERGKRNGTSTMIGSKEKRFLLNVPVCICTSHNEQGREPYGKSKAT